MVAMSYYGAEKAVPGYNVMGVAKSALESVTRYLAMELGEKNIRVNTISGGPLRTMSSMAVGGFSSILELVEQKAPLKRNVTGEDVGEADLRDAPRHGHLAALEPGAALAARARARALLAAAGRLAVAASPAPADALARPPRTVLALEAIEHPQSPCTCTRCFGVRIIVTRNSRNTKSASEASCSMSRLRS